MQNVLPYLFETYQHPKTRRPTSYSGLPFVTYYAIKSYLPFFKAKLLFLSYSTKHPHICTRKRSPRCLIVTFDCGCLSSGFFLLLPRIGRIHVLCLLRAKQKPQKPLGEDGGRCPCCYASALVLYERALNAQTRSLPSPSLQKVTILAKAINRE